MREQYFQQTRNPQRIPHYVLTHSPRGSRPTWRAAPRRRTRWRAAGPGVSSFRSGAGEGGNAGGREAGSGPAGNSRELWSRGCLALIGRTSFTCVAEVQRLVDQVEPGPNEIEEQPVAHLQSLPPPRFPLEPRGRLVVPHQIRPEEQRREFREEFLVVREAHAAEFAAHRAVHVPRVVLHAQRRIRSNLPGHVGRSRGSY